MRNTLIVIVVLAAIFGVYFLRAPMKNLSTQTVTVGGVAVQVEVANTEALRERGLSGRASLADGTGMLFVFERDGSYGFWMKDMKFPIDIIWADSAGSVITIEKNLAPETYPKNFYPSAPARYVLEVPAGFADAHGISTGTPFYANAPR